MGDGVQSELDVAVADRVEAAQWESDETALSAALDDMRATTAPNTYGEFRDDGSLATWLHNPEVTHDLLFVGSEA
ncbi:hypothetical protein [Cellulomonas fengjieae]|uniref:hypothetical protein n=1 Tax=Cellulomonas fengjieae TaxID=2819978 RepID=UPI001AB0178F|nr:hypothetical protein [Cellulomonas fengjieae]MBO3102270.1 hypothetical protein [Cellulomonas fengjieae]